MTPRELADQLAQVRPANVPALAMMLKLTSGQMTDDQSDGGRVGSQLSGAATGEQRFGHPRDVPGFADRQRAQCRGDG